MEFIEPYEIELIDFFGLSFKTPELISKTKPIVKTIKNIIPIENPYKPTCIKHTERGKNKIISKSNTRSPAPLKARIGLGAYVPLGKEEIK